jgi:hypothetical protein
MALRLVKMNDLNSLMAILSCESPQQNTLDFNEGAKVEFDLVLFGELHIGNIANLGLWLGDQDALYFAFALNQ